MLQRLLARPGYLLLGFAVLVALCGWQATRFEINASADTLIDENDPLYIRSREITRLFAPEEFLIIAYRPHSGDIFSDASLAAIQEISDLVTQLERVQSVRSVLNVPLLSRAQELSPDLKLADYTQQKLQLSPDELVKLFRDHPIYEGLLVNHEQNASGIQVLFEPLQGRERDVRNQEIERIRAIISDFENDADIYLGGVHVLGYQLIQIIKNDLLVFGSAIAGLICLLLLVLFRRWQWVVITAACCSANLVITLGVFGLLGLQATVISANFIALQLILSLAIVIHLIVQYRQTVSEKPHLNQRQLVFDTLQSKLAPCFFAGATTSVGFASLLLSDIKPVSSFGWMMVAAMTVTLCSTLLLFPALLLLTGKLDPHSPGSFFTRPLQALQQACLHHWVSVVSVFAGLLALSILGCLRLDVENSFINYFSEDTQVHREMTFIDQQFGGSTPLDIIYTPPAHESSDKQLILHAVDVQNTHRIQDQLDALPAMGTTLSVVNFTRLAKQMNEGKPLTEYELTSVYRTLDRQLRENLLGSLFVEPPPQLRISARVRDSYPGLDRAQFLATIHQRIQELGIDPQHYQLSNLFVLYQAMLEQLFKSQILTLAMVFAVLALAFWLIFRSLRIAMIAILPNIISALAVLGFMGWLSIPLDFMTITIAAIAMGIAVDDTIHYTHRYLHEVRSVNTAEALVRTHQSVGYALIYTTTIIVLGFCMLMFSDFVPSVLFGLLTALAVLLALLADLTLLPALLSRFVRR